MTTPSTSIIANHGGGTQNVKIGDGSQYNNNDRGTQINNSILIGVDLKDPKVDESKRLQEEKEDCLRSLNISSAHPKTCDWLFDTKQFQQWLHCDEISNHNGVLWVKGKPGTGKSTLMKHTLKHSAHFFNARGDSFEQTPLGMLRSLVYQLLKKEPSTYRRFIPLFRDKREKHREWEWQEPELKDFLFSEIQHCPKPLLLLIDALDECSESHVRNLVKFLENLSLNATMALNICLSSRHYPNISMAKHLVVILESTSQHDEDIIKYADHELTKTDEEIKREVIKKASGVFMWVVLVIEMLNKAYDEGRIEAMHQKLQDLPSELDDVFRTIIIKDNPNKQETLFMFQCVLFCKRLLRPEELYFAMIYEMNLENRSWKTSKISQHDIRRRITDSSRGLVEVRKGGTVQFIHESVKDFLVRNKRLQILNPDLESDLIGKSHERLRSCCMNYIMKKVSQPVTNRPQAKALSSNYPFLEYAAHYIFAHAEEADTLAQTQFVRFLKEEPVTLERLRLFHNSFETITSLGFRILAKILLQMGFDSNAYGGRLGTALQGALSDANNDELVAILLNEGANVNAQAGIFGTALQAAVYMGNEDIAAILLEAGANVNAEGGAFGTALHIATAENINDEMVAMLLNEGADIDAPGMQFGTALQAAAYKGDQNCVELLLERGANVNIQGGLFGTALQAAAYKGSEHITAMLLERGADVDAQGGAFGTALQAAVYKNNKKNIATLLDRGAKNNFQTELFSAALQRAMRIFDIALTIAAGEGIEDAVAKLLEKGANVNAHIDFLPIPLVKAIQGNSREVFTILVENGATVTSQNYSIETDAKGRIPSLYIYLCLASLLLGIIWVDLNWLIEKFL
ncbi:ankyrin repeat-containing domain protein [Trichoderma barbatum]